MVEFNNEEMQGERRETFVVLEDRLSEDSALKAIQEKLRPLLKRGFAGIAEKRMAECGLSNPYVYRASLARAKAPAQSSVNSAPHRCKESIFTV